MVMLNNAAMDRLIGTYTGWRDEKIRNQEARIAKLENVVKAARTFATLREPSYPQQKLKEALADLDKE